MKNVFDEFLKLAYAHYRTARIIFLVLCLVFGAMIAYSLYMTEKRFQTISIKNELKNNAIREFTVKTDLLRSSAENIGDTILAVKKSEIFNRYLENRQNLEAEKNTEQLFIDLLRDKEIIHQLRYIDANGDEIIRAERDSTGSEPYKIDKNSLQNKKDRYYLKEIQNTQKEIWFSKLDLNIEHGEIEHPIVPTLRVGSPLSNSEEEKGIVIANIFMEPVLDKLKESYFYYVSLVDERGEFLIHERFKDGGVVNYDWSAYLGYGETLKNYLPQYVEKILQEDEFHSEDGSIFSRKLSSVIPNSGGLILLFKIRQEKIDEYYTKRDAFLLSAAGIIFIMALPIAYLFARIPFIFKKPVMKVEGLLSQQITTIDEFVMLTITDKEGVIMDVTKAFCRLSGYSKEELIGKTHSMLRHPETPDTLYKDLWITVEKGKCWQGEIRDKRKDGSEFWVDVTIRPIHDEEDEFIGYAAYRKDITFQKIAEEHSITDKLSGVHNRRHFDNVFYKEYNRARRDELPFCFLMIDIDHFKRYNDSYGHPKGDEVIRNLGEVILQNTKRAGDISFRLGGEEFGILFREDDPDKAIAYAEKIRREVMSLEMVHEGNSGKGYVSVSIGLAMVTDFQGKDADRIYEITDQVLYRAKANGRNCVEMAQI